MNSIDELKSIIGSLGGSASFASICEEYQRKNKIVLSSNHKITLARTLNDNQSLVYFDKNFNLWILNTNPESNIGITAAKEATKQNLTITEVVDILKHTGELVPEKYDGSYFWMKKAIDEYSKLEDFSLVDVNDMNFIYSLAVGTWKMSVNIKKDRLSKTNLGTEAKHVLSKTIDEVWSNAVNKRYLHHSQATSTHAPFVEDQNDAPNVGMFGTGFMTFTGKLDDSDARSFIKMMVDIKDLDDSEKLYSVCENTLNSKYVGKGLKAAAASAILHCFKPYSFPVLNSNAGHGTFYDFVNIQLDKRNTLQAYIVNCRRIKEYRDRLFKFKNYRILDLSIWAVDNRDNFDLISYLANSTEKASR